MKGWRTSVAVPRGVILVAAVFVLGTGPRAEAQGGEPRVSRVLKDVKLLVPGASPRAASVNAPLFDGSVISTGTDARVEIASTNRRALARLGGKTVVRSAKHGRDLELQEGAVLFQVPRAVRGTRITTAGINVATSGTTGIIERYGSAYVKILVLEGTARVYLNKLGESVLVRPGQLLITKPNAATLPEAVHFQIAHLVKTSLLMNRDFAPLASSARISAEIEKQSKDPAFTETNLVIYGRGTLVTLVPPTPATLEKTPTPARPADSGTSRPQGR